MNSHWKRRSIIGAGFSSLFLPIVAKAACGDVTPQQTMGPFYPVEDQSDKNWDLTRVEGRDNAALGEKILIAGRVVDESCQPIRGALVEIWQACATGRYDHPGDPNDAELDPDFQYWGEFSTDEDGFYQFKTIIPGDYPASSTWQRPPHVHFRVQRRGYRELVTQMYFAGHPLNDTDFILQEIEVDAQSLVVIAGQAPDQERELPLYPFDLTLQRIGS